MKTIGDKDNCYITHSLVADLVFVLVRIFSEENYSSNIYDDEYIKEMKENHRFLGEVVTSLPVKGLEILEFLLECKEFNDLEKFKNSVLSVKEEEFFYVFYGRYMDKESIKLALKSDRDLNELYKKYGHISTNYLALKALFSSKALFLNELFSCLDELYTDDFIKQYENLISDIYNEEELLTKLASPDGPLEASQKIMGKTFKNRGPYKEFIFIPSSFLAIKAIRYFHKDQILFYSLSNKELNKNDITKVLKIISDDTRFEILEILAKSEPIIGKELAARLNLSTPTISHHIDQLKEAGFINEERVKNSKFYSLNKKSFNKFLDGISSRFK